MSRRRLEILAALLLIAALIGVGGGVGYWYVQRSLSTRQLIRLLDVHYHFRTDRKKQQLIAMQIRQLLRQGADPLTHDQDGTTALMVAAQSGDPAFVEEALRRRVPVNVRSAHDTALLGAVRSGSARSVELLLAAGADPELAADGPTPLAVAIARDDVEIARRLLAAGADPSRLKAGNGTTRAKQARFLQRVGAK